MDIEMTPDSYHHGALPAALRAATVELVAERGPSGFSLREVAKRAGVSHAAPQHHFGGAEGLLTSVAIEGFRTLGDAFQEASESPGSAVERLRLCGQAYVRTALEHPGHFGVMTQEELLDGEDSELLDAGARTFGLLVGMVEAVRDEINPDLDVDTAAVLCWASMHGLVELAPKLAKMSDVHPTPNGHLDDVVGRFTQLLIDGFAAR